MTNPKPVARPHQLRVQLLGALIDVGETTRTEMRGRFDKKLQKWVETPIQVRVPTLAGNVSWANVDRAAARWAA